MAVPLPKRKPEQKENPMTIPPIAITGGASGPAVAEGGNQGGATLTQSGFKIGIFGVVGLIVLSGALVWINRK